MEIPCKLPAGSVKLSSSFRKLDSSLSSSFQNLNLSSGNGSFNYSASKTPSKGRSKTPNAKGKLDKSGSRQCRTPGGDRFFADRSSFEMSNYLLTSDSFSFSNTSASTDGGSENTGVIKQGKQNDIGNYSRALNEAVLGVTDLAGTRVLSFTQKSKSSEVLNQNTHRVVYQGSGADSQGNRFRMLPKSPDRVLDAPDIVDDFYLNNLDWSSTNVVAIALRDQVYLWKAHTAEIVRLPCDVQPDVSMITSIRCVRDGSHILCATDVGTIQVWDINQTKVIRTLRSTDVNVRIAGMAIEGHVVVQGNRRGVLRQHDLRVPQHLISTIENAHGQEICGVEWSPDGRFIATGGNDNAVNIWDVMNFSSSAKSVFRFTQHVAAVKALCWSPSHTSLLASGGGTSDRSIKVWNVSSGNMLKSVDAESQVSGIVWSENYRELISAHGFSRNQLTVWKYPDMTKVGDILGHQLRILKMVMSPDQTTVATVSGDETLRFWRVFPPTKTHKNKAKLKGQSVLNLQSLR